MRCFTFALLVCVLERMVHQSNQWTNGVSLSVGFGWFFFGKNGPQHRKDIGQMILFSIDMSKQKRVFSFFQNMDTTQVLYSYLHMYVLFIFIYTLLQIGMLAGIYNCKSNQWLPSTSALVPRISRGIRKVNLGAPLYSWLGLSKSYKGLIIWG